MKSVAVPFGNPAGSLGIIEADRKSIAGQTFEDIDVLLLPTTTSTVPAIRDAGANPQALSPKNTVFANYYGFPAMSIPSGFDSDGLPLDYKWWASPGMKPRYFGWHIGTRQRQVGKPNIQLPRATESCATSNSSGLERPTYEE